MRTDGLGREEILDRIAGFHGHLGPYVVFGFRAGQLALRELGAKGYFDLEAVAYSGVKPPVSCFADGVQLGSGCTTGKGNLTVVAGRPRAASGGQGPAPGGGPEAAALFRAPSATILISVRPDLAAKAGRWLADLGDRSAAYRVLDLADGELFLVTRDVTGEA